MFRLATLLFSFSGCSTLETHTRVMMGLAEGEIDTTFYPLFIDGGTKLVYQIGHLTPDKGLKLYYGTIAYPEGGLYLDDSVRQRLNLVAE